MPPLQLTNLLQSALPGLSADGRAVISALGCFNGETRSPTLVATLVGMRSRYQLARALRRDGLPPLAELAAWTRVLYWVNEAECSGASLLQLARQDHLDATVAYRLVYRTTRLRWSEVRRAGLRAMVRRLGDRYRAGIDAAPSRSAPRSGAAPARAPADPSLARPDGVSDKPGTLVRLPSHPRGKLGGRLRLPGYPFDIAPGSNGTAWVSCSHAAVVECVQIDPLDVIGSIRTGAVPTRIVLGHSGEQAFVTNQFADQIGILDLRERRQVAAIPVPGNPLGVVLSLDHRTLYVTTNLDQVHAIRLRTRQIARSVPIPMACTSLLLHPGGTRLFVPTFRAGTILELDARTLQTLGAYDVGGVVHELACTPDGLRLYATNEHGWIDAIQLTTGRRDSLDFGTMAHGLALSPDGVVLYVGLLRAGAVAVVDRHTLTRVATIATGGKPRRIAFDAAGRRAIIANECGWVDLVV